MRYASDGDSVHLTFDDGPRPEATERVLDVLRREDVKATFFCVGKNAELFPSLVREIEMEGHAVGSHSYSHPYPRDLGIRDLHADYARGVAAVSEVLQRPVRLFRPPHGHLAVGAAFVLRWLPVEPWLWSVDPEDWRPDRTAEDIAYVAGLAGPGDVILLHDWVEQPWSLDSQDRSAMIAALPYAIERVRKRMLQMDLLQ